MLLIGFAIVAFLLAIVMLVVFVRLPPYRTDIKRGQAPTDGASPIWQVNVMSPANYNDEGKRLLRRFHWLQLAFAAALIGLMAQLWRL